MKKINEIYAGIMKLDEMAGLVSNLLKKVLDPVLIANVESRVMEYVE